VSDNKYGRIFTASDVQKILDATGGGDLGHILEAMDAQDVRFKWPVDEPLFILRGRDKRARGAVRFYADHQSAQAPFNHMNAVEAAYRAFDTYADANPHLLKEPD